MIMKFFVTVGRGTERFAESEIRSKFYHETSADIEFFKVRDGKILFIIEDQKETCVDKIMSLKCVERAFVTIADYENDAKGKRDFLNKLMGTMVIKENYDFAKTVLNQLNALFHRKKTLKPNSQKVSCSEDEEPHRKKPRLCNSENGEDQSSETAHTKMPPSSHLVSCSNHEDTDKNCEKSDLKTFRMSIKCSGKSGKWIDIKRLSRDVSWRISRVTNWIVDLRNQDFEICLHINDQHVTAGIPLTRQPLSKRSFIMDPGLRAPVAWIMAQLAEIKPSNVILDPMCGKGTLLIEACSILKDACYVGADIDVSQIQVARQNIRSIGYERYIDLFHADGLCLPFKPMSVDAVVCDAPFNQNHFISKGVDEFYGIFFKEIHRVLQKSGRFVLLTSQEISDSIVPQLKTTSASLSSPEKTLNPIPDPMPGSGKDASISTDFLFQFISKHYIKLGETHGEIIVMTKL